MPVVVATPDPISPFDEIDTILNFARVIANDCGLSLTGNLLSDSQPYTFTMLNLAWRKLQSRLSNNDIEAFPSEAIITALPAQSGSLLTDPSIKSTLSFGGYNTGDGNELSSFFFSNFRLPEDLEIPLRVWERVTGTNSEFVPMKSATDGLQDVAKSGMMRYWEWREQSLVFPGCNQTIDLKIRYKKFLRDLPSQGTGQVPLMRCAVALSYLVVEIFAAGRGSTVLPVFNSEKEDAIKQLINSTTRRKQRSSFRRIPYSRRSR